MKSIALLLLRLTTGLLLAGHGSQKLFGWFEGPGIAGVHGMLEKQGFRPARPWAWLAALSEFGGGVLMALGFLNPLGSMGVIGSMGIAITRVHWGKPIWASKGGAELPLTNLVIATSIALAGPGAYSLDHALGIRAPRWLPFAGLGLTAVGIAGALIASSQGQPGEPAPQPAAPPPETRDAAAAVPAMPERLPESDHTADTVPLAAPPPDTAAQ